MELRNIGSLEVSVVGLGCNNFGGKLDAAQTAAVLNAAIDAGITLLDTADIYGGTKSEKYMGQVLSGGLRERIVLATKFGMEVDAERKGAHPDYVARACEDSLRRLRTDRIDLYWLHQPDPAVPIADTLGALSELVAAGKVLEIGCSNVTAAQVEQYTAAAHEGSFPRFVAVQNEYSLLHREPEGDPPGEDETLTAEPPYPNDGATKRGVLEQCQRHDMAFVPYFPLASGLLSGKYRQGEPPPAGSRLAASPRASRWMNEHNWPIVEGLIAWSEAQGHTILELAVSWLLAHRPVASVIAGATTPEQARANAGAGSWRLTTEELAEVEALLRGE